MEKIKLVPEAVIASRIYLIRGERVMLDTDLATMYNVKTYRLNEAVKRNLERFPEDFMFQLTKEEWENLTSQFAMSRSWGGRRTPPYAFTEHGVLMLSSVLNSARAIATNIAIMRVFVRMNRLMMNDRELLLRMELIEGRQEQYDATLNELFEAVKQMMETPAEERKRLGYRGGDPL
ncbi:MAG: ORF6N domain-containing protein [Flavobacteriales bacterium]